MSLLDCKRSDLPVEYAYHLEPGVANGFFPKGHIVFFRVMMAGICLIPVAVFIFHVFVTFQAGEKLRKDDWVPALVVLVPITWFALSRLQRELWRKQLSKIGQNPLGVYFTKNFIIWQPTETICHVIDKHDLVSIEVTAASVHTPAQRARYVTREFLLELLDGSVLSIDEASEYLVGNLLAAFQVWKPLLRVSIPSELGPIRKVFVQKQSDPHLFARWFGTVQEEFEEPLPEPVNSFSEGSTEFQSRVELQADDYFKGDYSDQGERSLEKLKRLYPSAPVLKKVSRNFKPSKDPLQHFEQLLDLAGIAHRFTRSQPDGTFCHAYEQPLIIQRHLLDWLFALVLQEVDDLTHIVEPSVAGASPHQYVAVLWFDFNWNDYSFNP